MLCREYGTPDGNRGLPICMFLCLRGGVFFGGKVGDTPPPTCPCFYIMYILDQNVDPAHADLLLRMFYVFMSILS